MLEDGSQVQGFMPLAQPGQIRLDDMFFAFLPAYLAGLQSAVGKPMGKHLWVL